ncbi:MAG: hypothetical protein IKP78_08185 [Ruminococcus sp.]|nr:hypothetical protein [Ruminococcus sp.]
MKKTDFSKFLEIAAGAAAVLVSLGNFSSALISMIRVITKDYYDATDKIFRILMCLERAFLFAPVIALGVALILRWVSQNKMKWVVLGASALSAVVFLVYQLTDNIYTFVDAKTSEYSVTTHPIRDAFIFILYAVAVLAGVFLIYDAQSHLLKKKTQMMTLIISYVSVGIVMFIDMGRGLRAAFFIFPLLLLVSVFWRKELPATTPVLFGMGGAAACLVLAVFNAFFDPLNILAKNTDIFGYLLSYSDALIAIAMAMIPLMYLSREFIDKKAE